MIWVATCKADGTQRQVSERRKEIPLLCHVNLILAAGEYLLALLSDKLHPQRLSCIDTHIHILRRLLTDLCNDCVESLNIPSLRFRYQRSQYNCHVIHVILLYSLIPQFQLKGRAQLTMLKQPLQTLSERLPLPSDLTRLQAAFPRHFPKFLRSSVLRVNKILLSSLLCHNQNIISLPHTAYGSGISPPYIRYVFSRCSRQEHVGTYHIPSSRHIRHHSISISRSYTFYRHFNDGIIVKPFHFLTSSLV